jgi:hypothetical protein
MSASEWKDMRGLRVRQGRLMGWSLAAALTATAAFAQTHGTLPGAPPQLQRVAGTVWPTYVVPGEPEISTLYYDGSQIVVETEGRWSLAIGSDPTGVTAEDLKTWAERHEALMNDGPVTIVDNPNRSRTNIHIVFHADGSVPADAVAALSIVEAYLESLFSDPITVDVGISFQNMGDPNVWGATVINYNNNQTYTNTRNGLVTGMDSNDVIQNWLPTGSSCPVRYNGGSDTITQQSYINWPKAAYKATMGSTTGYAGSSTYNTQATWDYDPTDGITAGMGSFVDVAIHETGHALGFVSNVDNGTATMHVMDLYRFQRTDGCCDYNPDTYEEFQVRPRLVDFNSPDDDHNSDIITNEYRMSDGDPAQASHFRDQSPRIGLMGPYISDGVTYYPNYFTSADINMFDVIGFDYPPCIVPQFTQQPQNVVGCIGGSVQMSVAVNIPNPGYQWRIGTAPLPENGHYVGSQTSTLHIVGLTLADVSDQYNCFVTNLDDGCENVSNNATVGVQTPVSITDQPDSLTVMEYANASFHVTVSGDSPITYRWRRNGVDVSNGGNVYGATTANLAIIGVQANQAGAYDVRVTNPCGTVTSDVAQLCVNTGYGSWRGDLNCDGTANFGDINPFILALSSGETTYYNTYPNCHYYNGDINCDGNVDFGDINPFVQCMVNGHCP